MPSQRRNLNSVFPKPDLYCHPGKEKKTHKAMTTLASTNTSVTPGVLRQPMGIFEHNEDSWVSPYCTILKHTNKIQYYNI